MTELGDEVLWKAEFNPRVRTYWLLSGALVLLVTVIGIVLLDLAIYAQHVIFHKVPMLWRLHRMHHTDNDIDVTSGARFHPFERTICSLERHWSTQCLYRG